MASDSCKIKNSDICFPYRHVVLGKDSANYFFYTNNDTAKSNPANQYKNIPWVRLSEIVDSTAQFMNINYSNRKEHLDRIKIFEEGFIDKLRKKE